MKKEKEREKSFILWFDEIGIEDISLVGGKNASLGEMRKNTNVKIPQGFAITAYAYKHILEKAGILNDLKAVLHGLNIHDSQALEKAGEKARNRMLKHVISVAKKRKRKIGICGDAPSTYPEFAEFLVDCGIDSISLSPDAVLRTSVVISKHEQRKEVNC